MNNDFDTNLDILNLLTDALTSPLTIDEALMDELIRKLNAYRTAIERVLVAPFGSVALFEAKELQLLAQTILRERVRKRADALLGK